MPDAAAEIDDSSEMRMMLYATSRCLKGTTKVEHRNLLSLFRTIIVTLNSTETAPIDTRGRPIFLLSGVSMDK